MLIFDRVAFHKLQTNRKTPISYRRLPSRQKTTLLELADRISTVEAIGLRCILPVFWIEVKKKKKQGKESNMHRHLYALFSWQLLIVQPYHHHRIFFFFFAAPIIELSDNKLNSLRFVRCEKEIVIFVALFVKVVFTEFHGTLWMLTSFAVDQ